MIAAIVLAAGPSTRMGRPKQTLLIEGEPMLGKVLNVFRNTKIDEIVVVLGANADKIRRTVKFRDERVVVNPRFTRGMSSSIKVGLDAIAQNADAAVIALADQPLLSPSTVDKMVEAYLESKAPIVVPTYHGMRGNPVLFDRRVFPQIAKIHGDVGAKSVVKRYRREILKVEVKDRGVIFDVDTPSEYEGMASHRIASTSQRRRTPIRGSARFLATGA